MLLYHPTLFFRETTIERHAAPENLPPWLRKGTTSKRCYLPPRLQEAAEEKGHENQPENNNQNTNDTHHRLSRGLPSGILSQQCACRCKAGLLSALQTTVFIVMANVTITR